jgi:hypothetical protein
MKAIVLNDLEINVAKHVAKYRMKHNKETGAEATLYGDKGADHLANEINYFAAELAFCKIWNIYPDLNYTKRRVEDCKLPGGITVDVKWTDLARGRLMVKVKDRLEIPQFYALMVGQLPKFRFAGFMAAVDLLQDWRIDYNLDHPANCANQGELSIMIQSWA